MYSNIVDSRTWNGSTREGFTDITQTDLIEGTCFEHLYAARFVT